MFFFGVNITYEDNLCGNVFAFIHMRSHTVTDGPHALQALKPRLRRITLKSAVLRI